MIRRSLGITLKERICSTRIMVSACAALILVSVLGTSALAAQAAPQSIPAGAVVVPMTLDCVHMSQKSHAYAVSHHYCPATAPTGHVRPYNTTYGNCGSSWLLMWNAGGGNADFSYGFQSSQGNVVYRSLGLNWTNWSTGGSGSFGDSSWMNSSYYNNTRTVYTRAGFVTGSMSGWVLLWWGGTCSIIPPSDNANVTW